MARLEILFKDGGVEEFETVPVSETHNTNPSIPKAENQRNAFVSGAILFTVGRDLINNGVGLIGDLTGDYALERKLKGGFTALGLGYAFVSNPILTGSGIAIGATAGEIARRNEVRKKNFKAQQNAIVTGKAKSKNLLFGGAK